MDAFFFLIRDMFICFAVDPTHKSHGSSALGCRGSQPKHVLVHDRALVLGTYAPIPPLVPGVPTKPHVPTKTRPNQNTSQPKHVPTKTHKSQPKRICPIRWCRGSSQRTLQIGMQILYSSGFLDSSPCDRIKSHRDAMGLMVALFRLLELSEEGSFIVRDSSSQSGV